MFMGTPSCLWGCLWGHLSKTVLTFCLWGHLPKTVLTFYFVFKESIVPLGISKKFLISIYFILNSLFK